MKGVNNLDTVYKRPFIGFLNKEKVTILSLDLVERIKTNTISGYEFRFESKRSVQSVQ